MVLSQRGMMGVACVLALAVTTDPVRAHGAGADGRSGHGHAEASRPQKNKPRKVKSRTVRPEGRDIVAARPPLPSAAHGHSSVGGAQQGGDGHDHGPHTEHIFGFIEGADLHKPGETDLKFDNIGRFVRRGGVYHAVGSKLEVHTGVVEGVNAAIGLLGDYHRIRSVPGLDDLPARAAFSGASAPAKKPGATW